MKLGFQRRTDLALRVLQSLADSEEKLSGATLAASVGTSTAFLPQVVAPLIDEGWVTSERGPGGGYSLTGLSVGASLFDVLEATEGPTVDGKCVLRDQPCPGSDACEAHSVWTAARDALIDGFQQISAVQSQGGET